MGFAQMEKRTYLIHYRMLDVELVFILGVFGMVLIFKKQGCYGCKLIIRIGLGSPVSNGFALLSPVLKEITS